MKIVLIGDSIVLSTVTYGIALLTAGERIVTNLAASGNTVADQVAAWSGSAVRGDLTYDVAVVQVGVNDARTGVPVATSLADLDNLLSDIRDNNPTMKIILGLVLPARGHPDLTTTYVTHWLPYNAAVRAAGSGAVPTAPDLLMTGPSDVDFNDGNNFLLPLWDSGDHLHPSPSGARLLASDFRTNINTVLGVVEEAPDGGPGRGELQWLGTWRTTNIPANFNNIVSRAGGQPSAVQVRRRCKLRAFGCSMDNLAIARPAAGSPLTIQVIATSPAGVDYPPVTIGQMLIGESNVVRDVPVNVSVEAGGHFHVKLITAAGWTGTTCNPAVTLQTEET